MTRFTVQVQAHFESAHFLRSYHGSPEPLHGHSYKVVAEIARAGGDLDREEISVDFVTATKELQKIAGRLDYKCINDVSPFDKLSPTAENIATWMHTELTAVVKPAGAEVVAITIWEGPFNSVRYTP
jgi:6-pyruvoyltetrahydropterin/6-carboxytetrahydropterin synthase